MTGAAPGRPFPVGPVVVPRRSAGTVAVTRCELVKLCGQFRVRAAVGLALVVPFCVVAVLAAQSGVPLDTLFGAQVHDAGLAVPLVVLAFAGQWVLPLLTTLVAGDIFSAEDRYGTWKTVLTRSASRGQVFAGKVLAALAYTVVALVALGLAATAAGLLAGRQPVIGLTGQPVPFPRALGLVLASWATQLPPVLGFCAFGVLVSVLTRESLAGVGVPTLAGLLMQVAALVTMPAAARALLLSTPFGAWHGFWTQVPYHRPFALGLVTSAAWFSGCLLVAWLVFRRRGVRVG